MNRRLFLGGAAAVAASAATLWWLARRDDGEDLVYMNPLDTEKEAYVPGTRMRLREFGRTGLKVSEVGFGAWAIGGQSYGSVDRQEALNALSRAEELGCNFVDSALVYGDSERLLGEFLAGRRDRWIVATKFSGQPEGLTKTVEKQLELLGTDYIDYYQIHWVPGKDEAHLYDELAAVRKAGKVRFAGVSLYTANDIDIALSRDDFDGFMVPFNLLQPAPFLDRLERINAAGKAVIIRSALKEGFLTGKFKRDAVFTDPQDQRSKLTPEEIARTVDDAERFRFLEAEAGTMACAAARYALSFPVVSTVVMGTKSARQAESNFGDVPGGVLSPQSLARVSEIQSELGLRGGRLRKLLRRFGL